MAINSQENCISHSFWGAFCPNTEQPGDKEGGIWQASLILLSVCMQFQFCLHHVPVKGSEGLAWWEQASSSLAQILTWGGE